MFGWHDLCSDPQAVRSTKLGQPTPYLSLSLSCERTAPHPFDANLTSLSCERTAAHSSDSNLTLRSRKHTVSHSSDATLTPQPNFYSAARLADVNPATSAMRQRMVGDTPQLPSLSPNQEFDDAPPAVPAEIEPSSLPPLDRRSGSLVCPGWLASACDSRPTAHAPDLVLTNQVSSITLDDAQQCSLPPRCERNLSSGTRSQPF